MVSLVNIAYSSPRKRSHRREDSSEIIKIAPLSPNAPKTRFKPVLVSGVTGLINIDIEDVKEKIDEGKTLNKEDGRKSKRNRGIKAQKAIEKLFTIDDDADDDSELEAALRMGPGEVGDVIDLNYDLEGGDLRFGL